LILETKEKSFDQAENYINFAIKTIKKDKDNSFKFI
jgi:hypothetical protein